MLHKTRNRIAWCVVAVALMVTSACAEAGTGASTPPPAASVPTTKMLTPISMPYQPPTTAVGCFDPSFTNPYGVILEALQFWADALDGAVRPNTGPITTYLLTINRQTYASARSAVVVQIPAIAAQEPVPRLQPYPPASNDPYADALKRAKIRQANAHTLAAYQHTLAQQDLELAHVRQAVKAQTNTIRRLRPSIDYQAASVYGCVAKASEWFAETPGRPLLVIASDLRNDTWVDYVPPQALALRGAVVRIVFFSCQAAPLCQRRQAAWTQYLLAAGASSVEFYDVAASRTLATSTFFEDHATGTSTSAG